MVSRTMGVSRAQLSLRINRSADWQDRRCNRRNEEADAEILSAILNIISDMPSYGYRRVWGILRKQRRTEGQPPVNAKRLYRIMSEHNLLLLHHKPERPKREHKGNALSIIRERYTDFGPTLAREKLAELHDVHLSLSFFSINATRQSGQ